MTEKVGVKVGGVTIRRISGKNAKYIMENGIGPGAIIKIKRAGDVIPEIHEVIKVVKPQMPDVEYEWTNTGVDIYLPEGAEEDSVKIKNIVHFFTTCKVERINTGIATKLYNDGLTDIFKIMNASKKRLLKVPTIQDKTATIILNEIEKGLSNVDLAKLMYASTAFGEDLGEVRLRSIITKFPSIVNEKYLPKNLMKMLLQVDGISTKLANSFIVGLPKYVAFQEKLPAWINIESTKTVSVSSKLKNQKICLTGFRSEEINKFIFENGGEEVSGVTSKTTMLLVKDKSSASSKTQKAKELGIMIMTKKEFEDKYM